MSASAWVTQLRSLDAHPKTRDEFKVRTLQGGISTVVATVVALWLVRCELRSSWRVERRDRLYVNSSHGASVRVAFDVEFPNVACELISVDAMDQSGQAMGFAQTVSKVRLDRATGRRAFAVGHDAHATGATATHESHFSPEAAAAANGTAKTTNDVQKKSPNCGDCYGAQDDDTECCATCEDVRRAYRRKGWTFKSSTVKQCQSEGTAKLLAERRADGCALYGDIELPSVSGNFHFAPGRHVAEAVTKADLLALTFAQFNVSHVVKKLTFVSQKAKAAGGETAAQNDDDDDDDDDDDLAAAGDSTPPTKRTARRPTQKQGKRRRSSSRSSRKRRRSRRRHQSRRRAKRKKRTEARSLTNLRFSQLEGQSRVVTDGYGMHQYYLKVVPTTYVKVDGTRVEAAQYSVTEHVRHVAPGSGRGLPGVFFFYEVSPVCAEVREHRDGLPAFLVGLCAIVGGVYVTFGLLDRALTAALEAILDGKAAPRARRRSGRILLD